jgi:hypothetical protein
VLCAFDLLELDVEDLRRLPVEARKAGLAELLRKPSQGIALNTHYVGHGRLSAGPQARLRAHRVEAARLALPLRPIQAMAQDQEPGGAGIAAGGRGRVGLRKGATFMTTPRPIGSYGLACAVLFV